VYENTLAHELKKDGMAAKQQRRAMLLHDGADVGDYVADLLVEKAVRVEREKAKALDEFSIWRNACSLSGGRGSGSATRSASARPE